MRPTRVVAVMAVSAKPATTARAADVQPLALYDGTDPDERLDDTHRGHLIALDFGGPDHRDNLVPMYGAFNTGRWRQMESDFETWGMARTGPCTLTIECEYSKDATEDARVPMAFSVTAASSCGATASWSLPHHKPAPSRYGADATKKLVFLAERAEMESLGWVVEAQLSLDNFPSYRSHPVFSSVRRPYAFLDYMDWKEARANGSPGAWGDRTLALATCDFSADARARILAAHRVLNDGFCMSDDAEDPVYTNIKYRFVGEAAGTLAEGGHDRAPQVDHVVPKSMSGLASYSNAQVISGKHNSDKRARADDDTKMQLASITRGTGRTKVPRKHFDD